MAQEQSGYWDVEQCRWVGAAPTHVVPPDVTPVSDGVPAQREAPESVVDAPQPGIPARA